MGLKSKFKNFFLLEDEEYEYVEEPVKETFTEQENKAPATRKQNVVSIQSVQNQKSSKVILIEPRVYAEAQEVADHLVNRRAVIVNLQSIHHDQALRIVDFLSGAVYALGGDIQRIGKDIFLCTPDNVEVSGNISELLNNHDYDDTRWT
ncbi:cell division protein SepF [Bacillus niameyensis]|uniref:cell division protein SepF n=1 Tax=Bacillus niameyensis TaxID=1522308 RepID=UPI0007827249|nr:cell division protein SepF [Bacillus niameyensis]